MNTVLRGGTLVTMDPAYPPEFAGDLLITGTKIAAIGQDIAVPGPETEVIDVHGKIVTPGLVDTHRHVWQSLVRFAGADWTIGDYGAAVFGRYGPRYTAGDMYLAVRLGLAEALDAGITQVFDWNHNLNSPGHVEETVRAHRDSGMRTVLGYGESAAAWLGTYGRADDSQPRSYLAGVRRARHEFFPVDLAGSPQSLAMAVRGPEKSPMDVVAPQWALARELGLRISVHVGNGSRGRQRAVGKLRAEGLLHADTTYVHCSTLADDEIAMIADSGASASVAPFVEASMGHGPLAIERLIAAGCEPGLSVDTCANAGGDLFTVLRSALSIVRGAGYAAAPDRRTVALTCADVFAMGTIAGARANGLGAVSGSLTVGKEADITIFATDRPNLFPRGPAIDTIVLGAHPGNVAAVFVAGRKLKAGGVLLGIDLPALREQAAVARAALAGQ